MSRSLFMVVSLVLFVVGLFVIFNSVAWGSEAANSYLRSQGGMDGTQFSIVFQESINMYRCIGIILSGLGALGFVKAIKLR